MAIQKREVRERIDPVEVDINDTSLAEGMESDLDLKEDWQAKAAPPPGRTEINKPKMYKVKCFIEDTTFEQGRKYGFKLDDPNGVFYKKAIACKIQDPTGVWQDAVTYYNVSSGMPKGKKISSMAGFLTMIRVKVPERSTDLALAKLLVKAFEKLDGPTLIADCDWSAWDSTAVKRGSDFGSVAMLAETGKLANSMCNFPKKADGGFEHIAHTKTGLEVIPKLKVLRLFAPVVKKEDEEKKKQEEKQKTNGVAKPVVVAPKAVQITQVVEPEIELDGDGEVVLDIS